MGLIFKKYCRYAACEKCNTDYYFEGFSMYDRLPSICPGCKEPLHINYFESNSPYYYVLRGTNIKIESDSIFAAIFIQLLSAILGISAFLFFVYWLFTVFDAISFALTYSLQEVFFNSSKKLLGSEWPGFIILAVVLYFILQAAGSLYKGKSRDKYIKALAESFWKKRNDE